MVRKCLGKNPKAKKAKIETILNIDENTRQWVAKVMKQTTDKGIDEILPQDYIAEKIVLSTASREVDMKIWIAGNSRISHHIWKDQRDKQELKQLLRKMAEYIHEIQNPNIEALPTSIFVIDVESPLKKSFIEQVKRDHSISQAYGEWLNTVHAQEANYFSHFTNTNVRADKLMSDLESKMNAW